MQTISGGGNSQSGSGAPTLAESGAYPGIEMLEFVAEARNYNDWLADLVRRGIGLSESVVDFGAGSGTFARVLRGRTRELICIEPDPSLAARLRAEGFVVHEALAAIGSGAISAVYSLNVLEHLEDDAAALAEIFRVLVPGGRLVLFVPAFQLLYSAFDRRYGHRRRYSRILLRRRVEAAGFHVNDCRYLDSLGFFAALAFKLLDRGAGRVSRSSILAYDRILFPVSRRLDPLFGRLFGKNVYLMAEKPALS